MKEYRYRLVNVFTDGGALTGNPLCVFEDARGLDDATLQALALQFNLSETTFILPSQQATARVRIFTPAYEMPFAGHPTLGTAFVVNELSQANGGLSLEMQAGVIPVRCLDAQRGRWSLQAKAPAWRDPGISGAQLAAALGLTEAELAPGAAWINAGKEQLVVPLRSRAAVDACAAGRMKLDSLRSADGHSMAYVFHDDGEVVYARFFFPGNGAVLEDPAIGSACANLGGWFLAQCAALPLSRTVLQGAHVGRRSRLYLSVDVQRHVQVAGDVFELARGTLHL